MLNITSNQLLENWSDFCFCYFFIYYTKFSFNYMFPLVFFVIFYYNTLATFLCICEQKIELNNNIAISWYNFILWFVIQVGVNNQITIDYCKVCLVLSRRYLLIIDNVVLKTRRFNSVLFVVSFIFVLFYSLAMV